MTVRYLNTSGKEILIKDVVHLQSLGENFVLAILESGIMLKFKVTGVQDVCLDKFGANNIFLTKVEGAIEFEEKKANIWSSGVLRQDHGGWGAIIEINGEKKPICGGKELATRQRMELMAVVEALASLDSAYHVVVKTNSKYINDAVAKGWLKKWESNEWKREGQRNIANVDLWKKLLELLEIHKVVFELN
ncbi:MAG: hypothetical protein IJZ42_13060 [Lachnospiraceae bacterium]|nr:hypothetical protein [Lachnospiraceae bacterium]